jgi:precorrin-2 dehydrogenase/sirohydrochlorin ferrochelatase
MTHMPLFIDLCDKEVVIFGGGQVGERKAKVFCKYSKTKVVSKTFTPELKRMASEGRITIIEDDVTDFGRYCTDAFLVIPATSNRKLNAYIADYAKTRHVLVNQVDLVGEVITPSIIMKDGVTIGISTMGKSPASARLLRLRIEKMMDEIAPMLC